MLKKFEIYLTTQKRMSIHTVEAYIKDVATFLNFAEIHSEVDLKEINYQNIRAWMVALIESGLSNRTVNRKLSALRTFFKWCSKQGYVSVDPMLRIQGPKQDKRLPSFLKQEELNDLNTKLSFEENIYGQRDYLILELFYQTGVRLNELIELKVQDVADNAIKVLGKRNKERFIPIAPDLLVQLQDFIKQSKKTTPSIDYLFFTDKGRKLYPKFVYRKVNAYLSQLTNLDKTSPHVLRHTFATHMLNSGAGLETLKELLGHANLSATQVYTHNSFEEINKIYKQAHPRG